MSQQAETESIYRNFDSILKSLDIKYKDRLAIQALPKEKKQEIIQFREKIQIKNDFKQFGSNSQEITEYFIEKLELNPQFEDIFGFYEWITYQISHNQKLIDLEESLGVEVILSAIMQYGSLKHDNAKKLILLHILKVLVVDYMDIFKDQIFFHHLDESDVVHSLPQWLETDQVEMVSIILTLMDSIFWGSAEGLKLILEGFEEVQKKDNKPNKFSQLVLILSTTKSSVLCSNICNFLNSLCAAYKYHYNNESIIDELESSGLIDLLSRDAFNKIKDGKYFIEDCSFSKEDYYGVSPVEIFFIADYERRQNKSPPFFYRKDRDFGDFQSQLISLFIQIHELQQKQYQIIIK